MGVIGFLLIFSVFVLGLGLWLRSYGRKYATRARESEEVEAQLAANGVTAQAEFVSKRRLILGRYGIIYFAQYRYKPMQAGGNAPAYMIEGRVSNAKYSALKGGDTITVRYLTSDPNVVRIQSGMAEENTSKNLRRMTFLSYVAGGIFIAVGTAGTLAMIVLAIVYSRTH